MLKPSTVWIMHLPPPNISLLFSKNKSILLIITVKFSESKINIATMLLSDP